jgi:5-methylcytosine-specific restriction enzyme B
MTEQEIKDGIALLCNTSIEVQSYYQDDNNVVDALNAISDQTLKKLDDIYRSSTGVILSVRKELIQRLISETSLTVEEFQTIIQRHQTENKRGFRAYPTAFSIVFPLITIGHQEMDAFVKRFISEIKVKLGITELVKDKYVNFQGARQTGSSTLWFAVFNKNQKNQSTGLQLFVNVNSGKITYGIYRHADSNYMEGRYENTSETFDFNEMIAFFNTHKAMIIDDNPIVKPILTEKIEIGNHAVYKVSMGTNIFTNDEIDEFISNSVVLVHEDTPPKGTSRISQGVVFSSHVKEGDYFYLTNSNGEGAIKLLGRFKGEYRYPQGKYGEDGWLERDFELVKESISNDKYKGQNKWWTPDNNSTFIQVSDVNEANEILFKPYFNVELMRSKEITAFNHPRMQTEILPRNIILYGPPGTGKTYHTIDLSVSLTEGKTANNQDHETNKRRFDALKKEGQIEFITFHQNYSYEDFMVGLRPHTEGMALAFKEHKGIFYKLCKLAEENYLSSSVEGYAKEPTFEEVFDTFLQPLIEEEKELEVKMKSDGYAFHITKVSEDSNRLHFRKQNGGTGHDLVINTIKNIYEKTVSFSQQGLGVYYYPLVDVLKNIAQQQTTTVKTELKQYVLIIDEINRANISRVFGELITLLEDDKRISMPHELRITLPNGEKEFGIPPNLHVVGTMNTADKSIALVDIALRRRFEFEGKYPNYEAKDNYTQEMADLLKKLNTNIFSAKNTADFLIGHAYFMKGEAIKTVIQNKIIPLLMEYFNNRSEEVSKIFDGTEWQIKYNKESYEWDITPKNSAV